MNTNVVGVAKLQHGQLASCMHCTCVLAATVKTRLGITICAVTSTQHPIAHACMPRACVLLICYARPRQQDHEPMHFTCCIIIDGDYVPALLATALQICSQICGQLTTFNAIRHFIKIMLDNSPAIYLLHEMPDANCGLQLLVDVEPSSKPCERSNKAWRMLKNIDQQQIDMLRA
jgi:hypothetical protein